MATYINVPKPGAQAYTNQSNFAGKQQYDESDILYDSASVFYDSVNFSQYINVPKPTFVVQSIRKGMATGLLMPLTYSIDIDTNGDGWTNVPKPN